MRYHAPRMVRILVTNDDGIYSKGLRKLADACLRIDGVEVTIVAPDREQSATSHALAPIRPLRMLKLRENEYYVDVAETLRGAIAQNPFMKVFVANGYYYLA